MALNSQITDLAEQLSATLTSGQGSLSGSLGGGSTAFSWGDGLVPSIADFVEVFTAEGMTVNITKVSESGTPAAIVAPGGPKPAAATIAPATITITKHAGQASGNMESFVDARNLANAIARSLNRSSLKSFETEAVTKLAAAGGPTVTTATDWVSAITQGQGLIMAEGGSPSVVVVSAADYSAMLADVLPLSGISGTADGPSPLAVFGSALHVSSGAPAGTAYVLDRTAVQCVQSDRGVLAILDVYSQSANNIVNLIVDLLATTFVTEPAGVVKVTAPALRSSASAKKS